MAERMLYRPEKCLVILTASELMGKRRVQLINTQVVISRNDDSNPSKDNEEMQKTPEVLHGERYAGHKIPTHSFWKYVG